MTECARLSENHLATIQSSLGIPASLISLSYYDASHQKAQAKHEKTPEEIKAKFINAFGE